MLIQQPYGSLGMAVTTYTGQNVGAGNTDRVKKGFIQATLMALVFSVAMLPVMYLFGAQIAGFFVKETEVIAIGAQALRISSVFYFALGMIYVPRAVLNGWGDAAFAMVNGCTEVACRVGYAPLFTRIPALGYWGIWVTTVATWVTTALVCIFRYLQVKKRAIKKMYERGVKE